LTEATPPSEHGRGFPPFDATTFASQLIWLAICFAAIYVMVARVALPRVGGIIAARRDKVAADLAEAERLKAEADQAVAAYEKALAEARGRAHALAAETRETLAREAEQNRKAVEEELNGRLAAAERQIAASKAAAMVNVRGIAVEAAAAIVARLTEVTPAESAVASAVDTVLKR
jgi:F-type H+-transporting ATPase subunit b